MGLSGRRVGLSFAVAALLGGAAVAAALGPTEEAQDTAPQAAPTPTASVVTPTESAVTPIPDPGPPELLPNMRSLDAFDFFVASTGDGRELRFAAALANFGPGPLLLRPRPDAAGCPRDQHPASQVVFRDVGGDGVYRPLRDRPLRRRVVGCMLEHPDHDHWHFDAMASYALRDPATDRVLSEHRKVSFCLRDNRRVPRVTTRVRREHFGDCTRTRHQGISPGWVDVYTSDLAGQSLPLPRGQQRRVLCLDLSADPRDRIEEADETDNAVAIGLVVRGFSVRLRPQANC